jgi:translin
VSLDSIGSQIRERLAEKHVRREALLDSARELTQHAAIAIRSLHRGDLAGADRVLDDARAVLHQMQATAGDHSDLESAGYTQDAQKEYAEACITRSLLRGEDPPPPEALGVDDAAWLNGLGEAGGEMRRAALDAMRAGDLAAAEEILRRMDEIYDLLVTVDFPSAITRNLKRTNDMVRGVTERTRGDLTVASRQASLERALARVEERASRADPE